MWPTGAVFAPPRARNATDDLREGGPDVALWPLPRNLPGSNLFEGSSRETDDIGPVMLIAWAHKSALHGRQNLNYETLVVVVWTLPQAYAYVQQATIIGVKQRLQAHHPVTITCGQYDFKRIARH